MPGFTSCVQSPTSCVTLPPQAGLESGPGFHSLEEEDGFTRAGRGGVGEGG